MQPVYVCLAVIQRIGFVPAFFIYLLLSKKNKQALWFALTGLVFAFVFFIIPFGWMPFVDLIKLPGNYIHFSKIVWRDTPEIFAGLGFARFFIPGKINTLHSLLIALSFIIPLLIIGFWYSFRKKINLNNLPLATLKISLVVFYNFIDVPYLYLFYTSTFVSLVIALNYFLARDVKREKVNEVNHTSDIFKSEIKKEFISSIYFLSLDNLGTLCCPPSLPLLRSHSLNNPFGNIFTTGLRRAISLCRFGFIIAVDVF